MRLPTRLGLIDEPRARRQILTAVEAGVNYLDTAYQYHGGASEPFIGRLVAEERLRDRVRLATKLPPWIVKVRADMDRVLDDQLARLRTDRIDYYMVHSLAARSWDRMQRLGVLEFLDRARARGKIVNAGFSFHGDPDTFGRIVDAYRWQFCQIQLNYLDIEHQAGVAGMRAAAGRGMGVIVMEPLRGGNLARPFPERVADVFGKASARRTPAEWALRWVMDHPEVQVVLSGMNDEAHIDENLRIASDASCMTDEERAMMLRARDAWRELMRVDCTGCGYCMPCPEGVDIPMCFETMNSSTVFGDWLGAHGAYFFRVAGLSTGRPAGPSLCTRCGRCEKSCPQHLPIRRLLEEVEQEMEPAWLAPASWMAARAMELQRWALSSRRGKPGGGGHG